ncbi:hypothetical protein ACQP1K_09530 [Sphaerimonospora sp. CA-214678]|uniref:hypothetical protein n=1 Tax=Sphaerimonospora sp. CA-214678 TaxID=3240029 RepID=UPI003D941F5E
MSTEPKTTTIRVSLATRDEIAKLAEQEGKSMTAVVDEAIREHQRKLRWQRVAEQMERTRREDPEGWTEYLEEVALWDRTLMDGLDTDDIPSTTQGGS